jgi:hypothetical protein
VSARTTSDRRSSGALAATQASHAATTEIAPSVVGPQGSRLVRDVFRRLKEDFRTGRAQVGAARCDTVRSMSDEPTTPKLQVQIDEDIAQGVYSNLVLLNHTENEFVLDFAFIQPSNGRAKVRSRVISSPRHTKRLLQALQKNLERYEERFGTIDISSDDDPVFH